MRPVSLQAKSSKICVEATVVTALEAAVNFCQSLRCLEFHGDAVILVYTRLYTEKLYE